MDPHCLSAEVDALVSALEKILGPEARELPRYIPTGMSCSLGYTLVYPSGKTVVSRSAIISLAR